MHKLPRAAAVMRDGGRAQTREAPSGPGVKNPQWTEPKYGCFLTLDTRRSESDPQPDPPAKFLSERKVPRLVQQIQSLHAPGKGRKEAQRTSSRRKPKKRVKRITRETDAGAERGRQDVR